MRLSGLRLTKYLLESCKFDLPLCKKQVNLEDTRFISENVYSEIVTLIASEFKS